MPRHILVVEPDTAYAERFPDALPETRWHIECLDGNGCAGWEECSGNHEGHDPEEEDSPAFDQYEDVEIHGVLHEWHLSSWVIPFHGCVVQSNDVEPPDDLYYRDQERGEWLLPLGRFVVEDEWDNETECYLRLVGPDGGED